MELIQWLWAAVTVIALIDVFRHSASDWAYADRNRGFWAIFLFFFGLIFVVPYLVLVRSRFPKGQLPTSRSFRHDEPGSP